MENKRTLKGRIKIAATPKIADMSRILGSLK